MTEPSGAEPGGRAVALGTTGHPRAPGVRTIIAGPGGALV